MPSLLRQVKVRRLRGSASHRELSEVSTRAIAGRRCLRALRSPGGALGRVRRRGAASPGARGAVAEATGRVAGRRRAHALPRAGGDRRRARRGGGQVSAAAVGDARRRKSEQGTDARREHGADAVQGAGRGGAPAAGADDPEDRGDDVCGADPTGRALRGDGDVRPPAFGGRRG